ncbi:MAG: alpha/beta hydrolase, partial [Rhodoferax sp.]|nr:alpha/beta hydrolase [Rhodoferax sp.]
AIEHSADDAVPQPHTRRIFEACASADKTMECIRGATHYFSGQPELLDQAARMCIDWMQERRLLE